MKIITKLLLFVLSLCLIFCDLSAQVIDMGKLGLRPDGSQNAAEFLKKALSAAHSYDKPVIYFPQGVYHFTPDIDEGFSDKTYIVNIIKGIDGLTIDGGGSEFIFHGKSECFNITGCDDLQIKGFTIDWDRPMVTQGEFVYVSDDLVRLKIDKEQYPYVIEDGVVWYYGEGWKSRTCKYNQIFDKESRDIVPQTHDDSAGEFYNGYATEISEGVIEFSGPFNWQRKPEVGNVITMYNYIYAANTFNIKKCKNVEIKDVTVHHGGSLVVFGSELENVHIDNLDVIARKSKDRYFANMADGVHLKGCKGKILIENCEYNGSGDDFVNVHNMYSPVMTRISDTKLEVRSFKSFSYEPGDTVWHVSRSTGQRISENVIKSIRQLEGVDWSGTYELEFYGKVPECVSKDDVIESKVWLPEVEIRNNSIYKRHRGAGIRVTTPKKAVIHNNYFNTAGHALLIEGDIYYWLESGSIENLVIRNNVFDNCMTSGSTTGGRWEWGEAVIDITPSVRPENNRSPAYHHNIIISDNEFRLFDYPILRARSVDGLQFVNNKLVRSVKYEPYTVVRTNFLLEGCRNVIIRDNYIDKDLLGKTISLYKMKRSDITVHPDQNLDIHNNGKTIVKQLEW